MSCETNTSTINPAFERSSKRRKGYPSETKVKRGARVVHGEKELVEKLGRNDLCPCGSGRCFQALLPPHRHYDGTNRAYFFPRVKAKINLDFRFLFAYSAGR